MPQLDGKTDGSSDRSRHRSVVALLERHQPETDPIRIIRKVTRELVREAKVAGWGGPPFNLEHLASFRGLEVVPAVGDIKADARVFAMPDLSLRVEYDRKSSRHRVRFSIGHEITHTFFPDCFEMVRNRRTTDEFDPLHAEFEKLCNIGAAELLMPYDDFVDRMSRRALDAGLMAALQRDFDVSNEACLQRIVDLSGESCAAVFFEESYKPAELRLGAGSISEMDLGIPKQTPKLRIAFSRNSETWGAYFPKHKSITNESSAVMRCVEAEGFVSCREDWTFMPEPEVWVDAVAIPPVVGREYPRVVALVRPVKKAKSAGEPSTAQQAELL